MDKVSLEHTQAKNALTFIIPLIEKYNFKWVITGGFACYVYGVSRKLTDIDIDIKTSKNSLEFQSFLADLQPYITQPLLHFVDKNYDNYNFEVTYEKQIIDICPMEELKVFDETTGLYKKFYNNSFPDIEMTFFEGFLLPLLTKTAIIENKQLLTNSDKWHKRDIDGLQKLLRHR